MDQRIENITWNIEQRPIAYTGAMQTMLEQTNAIISYTGPERLWLVEHPHAYTIGRSGTMSDIKDIGSTPLYATDRGGKITYHGPGQRIIYTMIDLRHRHKDVRHYVHMLEQWMIDALAYLGVHAFTDPERIGIWVMHNGCQKKMGAIGLKVRQWVTYHGASLNVAPELSYFDKITPCGIQNYGVASLSELGIRENLAGIDNVLQRTASSFIHSLSC